MRGQKIPYEENHKITILGELQKKCNYHETIFPEENPWFPCTDKYFYKSKQNKTDGLHPECKRCTSKRSKEWEYTNYERSLASHRRWNKTEGCIEAAQKINELKKQNNKTKVDATN